MESAERERRRKQARSSPQNPKGTERSAAAFSLWEALAQELCRERDAPGSTSPEPS